MNTKDTRLEFLPTLSIMSVDRRILGLARSNP